jgi:hypothetical protein
MTITARELVNIVEICILVSMKNLLKVVLRNFKHLLRPSNIENVFTMAYQSPHNKNQQLDPLLHLCSNFYLDNSKEIVFKNQNIQKTLSLIKAKVAVDISCYNHQTDIQSVKTFIYATGQYADFTLKCSDGIEFKIHRCVVCWIDYFKKVSHLSVHHTDHSSSGMKLLLDYIYKGEVELAQYKPEALCDFYMIEDDTSLEELKSSSLMEMRRLLLQGGVPSTEFANFYIRADLHHSQLLEQLHPFMKKYSPEELGHFYCKSRDKLITDMNRLVTSIIISRIDVESSSTWLKILEEKGIYDKDIWNMLKKQLSPDILNVWTVFDQKHRVLENENRELRNRVDQLAKLVEKLDFKAL